MKKLLLFVAIAAAAMSCTKTNLDAPENPNGADDLTLSVNIRANSAADSRVAFEDDENGGYNVYWAESDELGAWGEGLYNNPSFSKFSIVSGVFDKTESMFEGTISNGYFATAIRFVHPCVSGNVVYSKDNDNGDTYGNAFDANIANQTIEADFGHLNKNTFMMSESIAKNQYENADDYFIPSMKHLGGVMDLSLTIDPQAVVDLTVQNLTLQSVEVTSTKLPTVATVNMQVEDVADAVTAKTCGTITITPIKSIDVSVNKPISVPFNIFPFTLESGDKISFTAKFKENETYYTATKEITIGTDAITFERAVRQQVSVTFEKTLKKSADFKGIGLNNETITNYNFEAAGGEVELTLMNSNNETLTGDFDVKIEVEQGEESAFKVKYEGNGILKVSTKAENTSYTAFEDKANVTIDGISHGITLSQAGQEKPAEATTKFAPTNTSYNKNLSTVTIDEIEYEYYYISEKSSNIQWKDKAGYVYNKTAFSTISSLKFSNSNSDSYWTVYASAESITIPDPGFDNENPNIPSDNWTEVECDQDNVYTFPANMKYFCVHNNGTGSGTQKTSYIEITYFDVPVLSFTGLDKESVEFAYDATEAETVTLQGTNFNLADSITATLDDNTNFTVTLSDDKTSFTVAPKGENKTINDYTATVTVKVDDFEQTLTVTQKAGITFRGLSKESVEFAYDAAGVDAQQEVEVLGSRLDMANIKVYVDDTDHFKVAAYNENMWQAFYVYPVAANTTDAEYTATVNVTVNGVSKTLEVSQKSENQPEVVETLFSTLTKTSMNLSAYSTSDITVDGITYGRAYVGNYSGDNIQFKSNDGLLYNETAIEGLSKIVITKSGSNNLTVYCGSAEKPTSGKITPVIDGDVYTYRVTDGSQYIHFDNGSGASNLASIEIYTMK